MPEFKLTAPVPDAKGKADADHYPTPPLLAHSGMEVAVGLYGGTPARVVEPGCSERAPFATAAHRMGIKAVGLEIRELRDERLHEGPEFFQGDYLSMDNSRRAAGADIIATNPPFSLAVEFVAQAVEDVTDSGLVMMLLQTGIEGAAKRREFWFEYTPVLRYIIRPRPGFVKGGNDSREYAFYIWRSKLLTAQLKAMGRGYTETRFLDCPREKGWGRAE